MPGPAFDTVIVRFGGEIGIKALWTRKQYERRLAGNIKAVHKHHAIPASAFIKKSGRLYIKTGLAEKSARKLSQVFGISSVSPAVETSSTLSNILEIGTQLAESLFMPNSSFAARCHRVGKHSYTSQDVCEKIGAHILQSLPNLKLHVKLTDPDNTLQVEVREEKAYVFTQVIKGPGGLPLGTQPKLICLLKGDTRSAAACWMTMKRGCPPVLIHFTDTSLAETKAQARKLMEWNIGFPRKLHIMKLNHSLSKEKNNLIAKRIMLRTAQNIAEMKKAEGIVTGDTLDNGAGRILHVFKLEDEAVTGLPVYRPLIGLDTTEINDIAARIGLTEPQSKQVRIKAMGKTTSKRHAQARRAGNVNLERAVDEALKSLRILEI